MAIEDGIDFVGALRRLVDTLRIQRNGTRRIRKQLEKRRDILFGEAGRQRGGCRASGDAPRTREGLFEANRMIFDVIAIKRAGIGKMSE